MSEALWDRLPAEGFGVTTRPDGSALITHPEYGSPFTILGRADAEWVTLSYRFPIAHRPLDAHDLAVMLDMNDQLVLFRLAFDDREKLMLYAHWPTRQLDGELFGFWVAEMIAHAAEGTAQLDEYFARQRG
ncbi:MAG: hypothetical protein KC609_07510 [Myxococcales bacterium]|nr:hypothetical protein [Myxococcales bacterium]